MKVFLGIISIVFTACALNAQQALDITVSIPPQAYLIERIAGSKVKVNVLVPDGKSPHDYSPQPSQLSALGSSAAFLTIGMPFENRIIQKVRSGSKCEFVSMVSGIKFRTMKEEDGDHHHSHAADRDHNHNHNGMDPHVWLDPANLKIMAKNAYIVLKKLIPASADSITESYRKLDKELDLLDQNCSKRLAPYKGRAVFVYHPAFGYFTTHYGLEQEAIEMEGKSPTPKQIMKLITEAKRDKVKAILVQPQFNTSAAGKIAAAIGGIVVPVNILERNVLKLIDQLALDIEKGFKGESGRK